MGKSMIRSALSKSSIRQYMFQSGMPLALLAATIALFDVDLRYMASAENLAINGDYRHGLSGWQLTGSRKNFSTTGVIVEVHSNSESEVRLGQSINVSKAVDALRFEASVATQQQRPRALLSLFCRDGGGRILRSPEGSLVSFTLPKQTNEWVNYYDVIVIPDSAETCVVELYVGKEANGYVKLMNVGVFSASPSKHWSLFYYLLLALWIAVGLFALGNILVSIELSPRKLCWATLVCAIALTSLMSSSFKQDIVELCGEAYSNISTLVLLVMPAVGAGVGILMSLGDLDRLAHLGVFALIALLTVFNWPERSLSGLALQLAVFAASTEMVQFFAVERQPRLGDWALDMCGVLLVLFVIQAYRKHATATRNG